MKQKSPSATRNPGIDATAGYASTDQVREFLGGISKPTLGRYRQNKMFPPPIYLTPRKPLWRLSDVDAWVQRQARSAPKFENLKNQPA